MSNDKTESISDNLRHFADIKEPCSPLIAAFREFGIDETTNWDDVRCLFRRIADEIDREIAEAKEAYLGDEFARFAEVIGKPMMEDETIEGWLGRWYLPRPLFEDGEPVQFGDTFVTDSGYNATLSSLNYTKGDHDYVSANGGQRHKVTDRFKRPKQQVLDADGVPIEVGDAVWILKDSEHAKWTVIEPYNRYDGIQTVYVESRGIKGHTCPENITHREPDTQGRIDNDATIAPGWYCAKYGIELSSGADFAETYIKMTKHLLRRQRELDGRDA